MTKIDIMSGFLGAGKTTLIKKLLQEALTDTKVVLIENEFGEIGIDGGFLKDAGIEIKEMNSGCICCSLVGDFGASLKEVLDTYKPERVIIEPSGVGKLSDVEKAVLDVDTEVDAVLNSKVAVVDATKCRMYIKNFGEFFINQIEHADTIVLSRTDKLTQEKLEKAVALIREHNDHATIITTPWDQITGADILATMEQENDLQAALLEEMEEEHRHHHHHHNHEEHECCCGHGHGHHHDHEEEEHECCCGHHGHGHHNHEEGHECCGHGHGHHHDHEEGHECCGHGHGHHHEDHHDHHHEHHHEHGEGCTCGCGGHHEHGHHHADEVFTSWGMETPVQYTVEEIQGILEALEEQDAYGMILRAKGMVPAVDGTWIYFDYVPGEADVRAGKPDVTGKLCVIGSELKEENLSKLFAK
ncbi:MAG: GTP-binding protein [Lachnospiraceae bacterium]|nr:GTP-binding protein [Lachnospiraceae bacterium]